MSVTLTSSVKRCNAAHSLGGLFLISSLGFTLVGCSGSDTSDDPLAEGAGNEASSPNGMSQPSTPDAPPTNANGATPSAGTDEDGPNVTDLDEDATSNDAAGDDREDDAEASGTPATPVAELEVPSTDHCAAVEDWDPEWVQFEEEVLVLVNEFRSQEADCGVEGQFAAAAPLTMDPILRCSARLHSLDMFDRDFFDHVTPDGVDPFERMAEAGFVGSGGGENIAVGQSTPEEVMVAWMESDGHCANVMRAEFATIGVGFNPGAGQRGLGSNYWTQNFGAPPFMRGGARR
jgi:uncharacterized protein YkwD